jgi:putative ABC transport system permease protein
MFWTQFKLMLRNLRRNKLHSVINIFGLAIAIALVLLLSLYVTNEISVDSFHTNKDRIYRVRANNGETLAPPFGQYILENVADAESYTRVYAQTGTLSYENKKFNGGNYLLVDSAFFTIFSFPIVSGETDKLLSVKENAVLSESFAKKIFGNKSPIGESINLDGKNFTISGIFQDFKDNTHFIKPNIIINFSMLPIIWGMNEEGAKNLLQAYNNSSFGLYVLAHENSNIKATEPELLEKIKEFYWIFQNDRNNEISFMPIKDVYFNCSALYYAGTRQGNKKLLNILSVIALAIVLIAAINYINLSITQSVRRSREVGIKKINGALRRLIIGQFLMESTIVSLISTVIAFILTIIIFPKFNQLVDINFAFSEVFNSSFLLRSLLAVFAIGLIAGLIPALILSGYKSVEIIKGMPSHLKNSFSQKAMVVFQYTVSIALIAVVAIIMKQNNYMKNYDLGFDKDNTFYIEMNSETNNQKDAFRNELMKIPGVKAVSFCQDMPGVRINNNSFVYNDKAQSFDQFRVDTAFFSALGVHLKNKITITDNIQGDDKFALILNQTAVNELQLEQPYNEFRIYNNVVKISEVVDDMNFRSLYQKPRPTMFELREANFASFALVRGTGGNLHHIVEQAKTVFKDIAPSEPLVLNFLDDTLNAVYQKEERTAKIVGYFAIFAILISSLGIFALASHTAQNRRKEIGVRKVNGAQISQIINLLNTDFVKWVIVALFIAMPLAWYAVSKWLENFAYKTEISWWIFALAGCLALTIALLTVCWKTFRAAWRNPVEAFSY